MTERRRPKIQLGRRKSDIPIQALEDFKDSITTQIQETIKVVVNGKIDKIDKKLDDYILSDTKWKVEQETYRKESTDPVVKTYNQTTDFWAVLIAVLKFMGILGAAIVAWGFIKTKLLS